MKKFYFIILCLLFFIPVLTLAQSSCPPEDALVPCGGPACPCNLCHFFVMINRIVKFLLEDIVPIVAGAMLVVAGILMIFSSGGIEAIGKDKKGSPGELNRAKKLLSSVIIGILIIYTAWILISVFLQTIGVMEWTGLNTWWVINCDSSPSTPIPPSSPAPPQTQPPQQPPSEPPHYEPEPGESEPPHYEPEPGESEPPHYEPEPGEAEEEISCSNYGLSTECSGGDGCVWAIGPGNVGMCFEEYDCQSCGDFPGGCTGHICLQIGRGNRCSYNIMTDTCVPRLF